MNIKTLIHIRDLLKTEAEIAETTYQIIANNRSLIRRDLGEDEQIPDEIENAYKQARTRRTNARESLEDFENHEWN